ncbi:hypothetical protein LCGC14_2730260, partial [marine sediment metagenome]
LVVGALAHSFGLLGRFATAWDRFYEGLTEDYRRSLIWSLRHRWVIFAGLAAAFAAGYHALGWKRPDWPTQLSPGWQWLWPPAMYRAVLLGPVWGAWSMLVVGQFNHPVARTDRPTRELVGGISPLATAVCLALPLAGTVVYLLHLAPALRFVPAGAAIAAALAGGALLVRLAGGLCRGALLATNILTQLAFLAASSAVM